MKSKNDIIKDPSGLKAVNAFIFAGSFSIGTMEAGFDLQKVLEISNSQLAENAFFFKKNVKDVPVISPDEWENEEYLSSLKNDDISLMCCNCPCSSLSQINRNASVDGKNNVHFYRLFNVFKHVQPKVFIIENAPTLIKLGYPILKDMMHSLSSLYKFTVVRDFAGNHCVPMSRQRTLVFGWRNDVFKSIPVVKQDLHAHMTVKDTLNDIINEVTDGFKSTTSDDIRDLYKYAVPGYSLMSGLAIRWLKNEDGFCAMLESRLEGSHHLREVKRIAGKMSSKKNCWDKSPYKLVLDERFPSFTSVSEYLHPLQDRMLSINELKRIMNYPSWYDFTDEHNECKIPVAQAMAQGVPVNFGKYAAMQARNALEGKLQQVEDSNAILSFQHHSKHMMSTYALDELDALHELDLSEKTFALKN